MARLRKFVCYRNLEKPYTRWSKLRNLCYVKGRPPTRIAKFESGDPTKTFDANLLLILKKEGQIRDNALESARMAATRFLEKNLGKSGFHLKLRAWPHHVLRENPLAAGAGADRLSTGMAHPFGKPIGLAVQAWNGKELFALRIDSKNLSIGREALKRAVNKLPLPCTILTR